MLYFLVGANVCTGQLLWAWNVGGETLILTPTPLLLLNILRRADYNAMRQFYDSTGGRDKWLDRSGWMRNRRLVGWKGVELNEDGRVRKLVMEENECTGDGTFLMQLSYAEWILYIPTTFMPFTCFFQHCTFLELSLIHI